MIWMLIDVDNCCRRNVIGRIYGFPYLTRSDPSTGLQLTRALFVYLSCRSLFRISDVRRVSNPVTMSKGRVNAERTRIAMDRMYMNPSETRVLKQLPFTLHA
jgi:hypothetical protein